MALPFEVDDEMLKAFCRRWGILSLEVFGSALREDFGPKSDVDLLATFDDEAERSLFDHVAMEEELGEILGRDVDLVNRRVIEASDNWVRRRSILSTAEPLYAA